MVATVTVPLLHVPPVDVLDIVADEAWQILSGPEMVAGSGLTVMTLVAGQPVGKT